MLTYTPFESKAGTCGLRGNPLEGAVGPVNVGETERVGSIIGGTALAAAGLSRRSLPGLLLAAVGGLFIIRGFAGHCRLYESIGVSTADQTGTGHPDHTGHKIEKAIVVARPSGDVYRFWRNFENLPEFMENIESVRLLDDRHSHWVAKGPGGQPVEWDAEIINEHPGEMISWQTLPGSDVQRAGTVRFTPQGDGDTLVRVIVEFHPPHGAAGARFPGNDSSNQLEQDLARMKEIIENRQPANVAG